MDEAKRNIITGEILAACIEVHRAMGPGLLESVYEACLMVEFKSRGINAKSQVILPVKYKDIILEHGYKVDILVEDEFILMIKSVENILTLEKAQLETYIKHAKKRTGFLINFYEPVLSKGFHRIIQGYDEQISNN